MKNFIYTLGFLCTTVSLQAQITFEVCSKGNSIYELFQKDEKGNLMCREGAKSIIIFIEEGNDGIQEVLNNKTEDLFSNTQIEKILNLSNIFKNNSISVLSIDSIDSFGGYQIFCLRNGHKGYLIFSLNSKMAD